MYSTDQGPPANSIKTSGLEQAIMSLAPDAWVPDAVQRGLASHPLISVTDRDGRIVYANDRFCETSGYTRGEIVGRTHKVLRSGKHDAAFYEDIWSTVGMGGVWTGDIRNKAKDGSLFTVRTTIGPVFDAHKEVVGYFALQSEAAAAGEFSTLKGHAGHPFKVLCTALDTIDSSICILDRDGTVLFSNKAQEQLYPDSAVPSGGRIDFREMVRKRRPDLSGAALENYIREIFSRNTQERRRLPDGRTVQISRTITPDGCVIGHHTDITELVRQNELLSSQAATMDLMMAVAVDANEAASPEDAYARGLERICSFTGWEVGHVFLAADDGSSRTMAAGIWFSLEQDGFASFREKTRSCVMSSCKGLPGRVIGSGMPEWVRDVTADESFARAGEARESGLVGGVAFPIKLRGRGVAALEFYSRRPIEQNPRLEEILSHVCDQISRVVERSHSEKTLVGRVASELRKRDRELVEQHKWFDAALRNMSQGLCMYNAEQQLIVSNRRYAEMYNLPPDLVKPGITLREVLEHRIANGIYSGSSPEEYVAERMAWVTSGVRSSKVQHLSDGRAIAITHQPMEGGGWLTTHEDITERIQSEKALRESQELFSKAFRASPAAIAISNPRDGSHLDVNEAWTDMLGYSREEAMAASAVDLGIWFNPEERSRFVMQIAREGSVKGLETTFRAKDGRHINVIVSGEPVDIGGKTRLLVVSYDITERVRSERALRESQKLLDTAFRASPVAMTITAPVDGRRLDVNETWCTMFGYSREEALAKTVPEIETWVEAGQRKVFVDKVMTHGSVRNFEAVFRASDGRQLDVLLFGERVVIGGEDRMLVVTHDITERKKAEEALRESEARFKNLVESTNVVPWEFDPDTMRFTYVGPQAVAMFGYPAEDWYLDGFWQRIIHPDDQEQAVRICAEATRLCKDHDFEYRIITADGEERWVRDVVSVVTEDGKATGLRGVLIDVSERKLASEALMRSEQRFKDIVEISSDWIWECDENLRFTYVSDRFSEVTGASPDRIIGKTRHEVGRGCDADWEAHLLDLMARRPFREFMYSVVTKEGGRRYWSISGRPMFDEKGAFKGYRGTGYDRTAEVKAEAELIRHRDHLQDLVNEATAELKERAEELRQALAKEKELNELQRQFVSMASHEFRTPLAIIDSAAQRIQRRADRLDADELTLRLEKIRSAVGRMTQLMESTLAAARIEEGRPTVEMSACDVGALLNEICERQQELAAGHVISCTLNNVPETIKADAGAIEQVFTNLLSNAVKYSPDAPHIEVSARGEDGHVVVCVRDYGVGIEPDELPKMFQRFFRARTSAGIAGTGIGLNLVKTLVELHEGSVSVESGPGEGSRFTVRLPVCGPAGARQTQGQAA